MPKIHISSEGDTPYATVKRQLGQTNFGLYCDSCREFFAVFVNDDDRKPLPDIEFISDGAILFRCPFCTHNQRRAAFEIIKLRLTEELKRAPAPH